MKEKLLFLTPRYPYPPEKGDTIRVFHMIQFLSQRYDVTLVSIKGKPSFFEKAYLFCRSKKIFPEPIQELIKPSSFPLSHIFFLKENKLFGFFRTIFYAIICRLPLSVAFYYHPKWKRQINDWIRENRISKIVVFSVGMSVLVSHRHQPVFLDICDVEVFKWHDYAKIKSILKSWFYQLESRLLLQYLRKTVALYQGVSVISHHEQQYLTRLKIPYSKATVIPNGFPFQDKNKDFNSSISPETKKDLKIIFIGVMSYFPNVEGVLWFYYHVWPFLQAIEPRVTWTIVGQKPVASIQRLAQDKNIFVTGHVPSVSPYLIASDIVIVPLKLAYGMQNKVLEAIAFKKKLIVTPKAMRGIDWEDEGIAVVRRDSNAWLEAIVRLKNLSAWGDVQFKKRQKFIEENTWEKKLLSLELLLK